MEKSLRKQKIREGRQDVTLNVCNYIVFGILTFL